MWIIKNKKIFLTISALLVGVSLVAVVVFGLKLGIDFKGGAQTEIKYAVRPTPLEATTVLHATGITDAVVQEVGMDTLSIKTRALSETERQDMIATLQKIGQGGELENFNSIGPSYLSFFPKCRILKSFRSNKLNLITR